MATELKNSKYDFKKIPQKNQNMTKLKTQIVTNWTTQILTKLKTLSWTILNFWHNFNKSFGKSNMTPWQLKRCTLGSFLQYCDVFGKPSPGQVCSLQDCVSVRLGHFSPSPSGFLVTSRLLSLLPPPQAWSQGPKNPRQTPRRRLTRLKTSCSVCASLSLGYNIFKELAPRPILSSIRNVCIHFCLSLPNVIF